MRERREEEESTLKGEEDRDRKTFEQRSHILYRAKSSLTNLQRS